MAERLDGTIAFLTGASSRTRTATASALARQGAAVTVLGLRSLHGEFRAVNPARRLTPRTSLARKSTQTSIPGQGASR
jgi:NAD(P)-dependent dehydrogenase (short-subunit alcohol dehydrogenase family)